MKILICGDRHWDNYDSVLNIVKRLIKKYGNDITIIEGGATGADTMAKKAAVQLEIKYKEYPANWELYGKKAGPIRNQQMLDEENPDIVIAFTPDINKSIGTRDMCSRAKKANKPVYIFNK